MNKIIESIVEEKLKFPPCRFLDADVSEPDLDEVLEEMDIANDIFDAHDDPC